MIAVRETKLSTETKVNKKKDNLLEVLNTNKMNIMVRENVL